MKVVEDFLPDEMFRELSFWLCGGEIAWYFSSNIANEGEENSMNSYFTHTAYLNDEWRSNLGGDILRRLVDEIKDQTVGTEWEIKSLLRVKANLYPRTETLQSHDKHFDFPFSHKAILFYVNDNDGKNFALSIKTLVVSLPISLNLVSKEGQCCSYNLRVTASSCAGEICLRISEGNF